MKLSSRLVTVQLVFLLTAGWMQPALASGDGGKKPAEPAEEKKEEKKINYIKEQGTTARGYNYKRVARDAGDEPQLAPKLPPPPPPEKEEPKEKEKKEEGHGAPAKEEEKKDHEKPKEEKKKDGGGGHGAPAKEKKAPPALSTIYDPAIIKLNTENRPFTEVVQSNPNADYFLCRDTVSKKYRDTVFNEINTFADRMGLPHAKDMPCMVKVAKPKTKFPGAIFIEFFVDEAAARACMRGGECGSTRVMMLHLKDKTGKKSQEIYRSYVITDERKYKRASYCVSPDGKLLGEKSCYVALNPDWLFN